RAERTADRSLTVLRPLGDVGRSERAARLRDLCQEARAALTDAEDEGDVRFETGLALRYRGQSYELSLPDDDDVEAAFHAAHEARFGWRLADQEVQLVHLRARASVSMTGPASVGDGRDTAAPRSGGLAPSSGQRTAVFDGRSQDVPTHERALLGEGDVVEGPAIIDEYSGTTVVPPGTTARVVASGGLLLTPTP
ncbi:MAG: hypothetical protein AAGB93_13050, partial [Planctomycetota bacterium]